VGKVSRVVAVDVIVSGYIESSMLITVIKYVDYGNTTFCMYSLA